MRVSSTDQNEDRQLDAMTGAGVQEQNIFLDKQCRYLCHRYATVGYSKWKGFNGNFYCGSGSADIVIRCTKRTGKYQEKTGGRNRFGKSKRCTF